MRRIIYASAAAAVFASTTGCQHCFESFRRFEAWKFATVFGHSPDACQQQVVAMPTTVAAPICPPIDACSPSTAVSVPAYSSGTLVAPSAGCPCNSGMMTTIPSLPGTIAPSTTYAPGTTITNPIPGPTGQ
jgi:hypothetical protein